MSFDFPNYQKTGHQHNGDHGGTTEFIVAWQALIDYLLSASVYLFVCLVELIQENMKGLEKIYRMEKHLVHWEMESRRGHNILINGYGILEGKYNLAAGSFGFGMRWTSMIWKEKFDSQRRELENIT